MKGLVLVLTFVFACGSSGVWGIDTTNFHWDAISYTGQWPADPGIAVGLEEVVVVTNGAIAMYNKGIDVL